MGLFRFFLAFAVLYRSCSTFLGVTFIPGPMAVQVFFVISGFYMALVLAGKYTDAGTFYLNRFLRLYPAYLTIMLLTWGWFFFVWWMLGHEPKNNWMEPYEQMSLWQKLPFIFSNWSMIGMDTTSICYVQPGGAFRFFDGPLPNIAPDGAVWGGQFRAIEQAWSVGAEIWFYILAPFLCRMRSPLLVCIAAASAALRVWMERSLPLGEWFGYFFVGSQFFFFLFGILIFRFYKSSSFKPMPGWALAIFSGIVFTLALAHNSIPKWVETYLMYPLFIGLIPYLFHWSRDLTWDRYLGNYSYTIYISHLFIVGIASTVLKTKHVLIILPITLLLCWAIYRWIEEPVDRWRQKRAREKFKPA